MKPQRATANDSGVDWTAFWAEHAKEIDAREMEAANDDEPEREPSGFALALALIAVLTLGFACIGAIQ